MVPPVLVREEAMEQAGFFPTDRAQVYEVDDGELFLVGTSEVPLSAIHRDEILPADDLPRRYLGISSCFRREAGTYGKDTRGIFRVHQFDKVEMFSYADPATSWDEHEALLAIEESIVGGLGLPYRVVNIAAGDLGAAAAKKYDVEVWLPSEGAYRELTSCSNYLDFSARRLATRVKGERAATSSCTRSTAPRARSAARWCSCSSTTRTPTAASPCPRCCARTPASTASRPSPAADPARFRSHAIEFRATLAGSRSLTGGGVPERPNGTVLKTVEARVSEGSNPSPSATRP